MPSSLESTVRSLWPLRRRDYETEFLPAALEILDAPPSPLARAVAGSVALFLAGAVAWATLGQVDIVAVGEGRIVPSGYTKTIQAFETSVVRSIAIRDGQHVDAGDLLIELDATVNAAERERLAKKLAATRLEILMLKSLLGRPGGDLRDDTAAKATGAEAADIARARDLAASRRREQNERLGGLDREREKQEAAAKAVDAEIAKLEQSLPLLKERVDAREILLGKGLTPRMQVLELRQQLVAMRQDLQGLLARREEATAAIAAVIKQRAQVVSEFENRQLAELIQSQTNAAELEQELTKAEHRQGLQRIVAPVDGVVQQLAVHTIGGVVQPAQPILAIVPVKQEVEIEAMVLNKDIGFVHTGQIAAVKLDAFPFTRYGTLPGRVVTVSSDAIKDEKLGLVYAARIALDRATITVDSKLVNLTPGLQATVEIKTGKRRLIYYLLSPVLKGVSEAARER